MMRLKLCQREMLPRRSPVVYPCHMSSGHLEAQDLGQRSYNQGSDRNEWYSQLSQLFWMFWGLNLRAHSCPIWGWNLTRLLCHSSIQETTNGICLILLTMVLCANSGIQSISLENHSFLLASICLCNLCDHPECYDGLWDVLKQAHVIELLVPRWWRYFRRWRKTTRGRV